MATFNLITNDLSLSNLRRLRSTLQNANKSLILSLSNSEVMDNSRVDLNNISETSGFELVSEDSVIYVPGSSEEEDNNEDHTLEQISDVSLDNSQEEVPDDTVIENLNQNQNKNSNKRQMSSCKRKRNNDESESSQNDKNKRPRTTFDGVLSAQNNTNCSMERSLNESIDNNNNENPLTNEFQCSTPVIPSTPTTSTICNKNELSDISPICEKQNAINSNINNEGSKSTLVGELEHVKKQLKELQDTVKQFTSLKSNNNNGSGGISSITRTASTKDMLVLAQSKSTTSTTVDGVPLDFPVCDNGYTFVTSNIQFDGAREQQLTGLKPICIDGPNIAMLHGQGHRFSVRGLRICIDFFLRRGHKVYAFVPAHRMRYSHCDEAGDLQELMRRGLVVATSSWETSGGKRFCAYDDRIMLQAAAAMGAVVVSRDQFRDLRQEDARFEIVVQRGLLMPHFIGDILIFPQDPLGRRGPNLDRFLRFP